MINITLKQLRYFDALARELHFGRAAEACSVTQPALSMQIQEFEQNLQMHLIERTRSGVQLTPQGAEVAARAARILSETRDLIDLARAGQSVLSGALRFGVIPSIAPYMLPPLLPILRREHPDLELSLRETQTHALVQELADGKLDVLLLALPIKHSDVEVEPLFEDRFVLALPGDREMTEDVRATPEFVEHERLLLLEEGHCLRDQALSYCELQQVKNLNTFGASSLSTIVELVAAGHGITLLPEISLGVESRGRSLNLMRFAEPEPERQLGLVWRATSPRKSDFLELARIVREAAEPLVRAAREDIPPAAANGPKTSRRKKTV
ncbi:MAG: LysR family transcriptional regulator [Alphaproteobacteria bacterium BRH_c36]|nr:MAG: LysR family transcriptional regulator [Alphaproteobacteria bacterium BRH_c36]